MTGALSARTSQDLVEEPVPIDRSGAYFKKQRSEGSKGRVNQAGT